MSVRTLPEYATPPLHEVALAVQFEQLAQMGVVDIGKLYNLYEADFPIVETHPPLEPKIERFGTKRIFPHHSIRMLTGTELPRVFFLNTKRTELLQVQADQFAKNWRKVRGTEIYPRYEKHVRPNFEKDYRRFLKFVTGIGADGLNPLQCEVTYVNHISPLSTLAEDRNALTSIFAFFGEEFGDCFLEKIEGFSFKTSQVLTSEHGERARLTVHIDTGLADEDGQQVKLTLTVRGAPHGKSVTDIMNFMDFGRGAIIKTFDKMTSIKMHNHWGKKGE